MISRAIFLIIAIFWLVMNVWLWRAEYSGHGSGIAVPVDLVWRKILTAPDASSLTVYQGTKKTGFCQFSTSIEQAMAVLDEDNPPPEGIIKQAGYQIRFDGNVSLGDFTNRLTFNGRVEFSAKRTWRELNLKITAQGDSAELHSIATNQTIHLKVAGDGVNINREFTFADLQDPDTLLRALAGDSFGGLAMFPLPHLPAAPAGGLHWEAHHTRLMVGREPVSAYRLETRVMDHLIVVYVSTLGEILRIELPGGTTALLDQISN